MAAQNNFLNQFAQCINDASIINTRKKIIVIEENKRRYTIHNNSQFYVTKVQIEGCVAHGHMEKGCEAVFYIQDKKSKVFTAVKAYFVELKGCSVGDALKQIENSYEKTKNHLKGIVLHGRIIPSEYKRNKFLTSIEKRLLIKFKLTGGDFKIQEKLVDII